MHPGSVDNRTIETIPIYFLYKENPMKSLTSSAAFFATKHANTIRVMILVFTLAMFIFAAGAAEISGTVGR